MGFLAAFSLIVAFVQMYEDDRMGGANVCSPKG